MIKTLLCLFTKQMSAVVTEEFTDKNNCKNTCETYEAYIMNERIIYKYVNVKKFDTSTHMTYNVSECTGKLLCNNFTDYIKECDKITSTDYIKECIVDDDIKHCKVCENILNVFDIIIHNKSTQIEEIFEFIEKHHQSILS